MIPLKARILARALGTSIPWEEAVTGLCIDSRQVRKGDLFVALPGSRTHGELFAGEALERGAVGVLVGPGAAGGKRVLTVPDPQRALWLTACAVRERFKGRVLGITGSAGKTSVKEFLRALLPARLAAVFARASHNNALGVPLSLGQAEEGTHWLVVELGSSNPGELASLCALARPDMGVLTAIGPSHLQGFQRVEAVLREKLALALSLPPGALLFINQEDPWLAEAPLPSHLRVQRVALKPMPGCRHPAAWNPEGDLRLGPGGRCLKHGLRSRVAVRNLWLAAMVASALGCTDAELVAGALLVRPPALRGEERQLDSCRIILDCYNANPLSMEAALSDLKLRQGPRGALLGEMLELGAASAGYHRELGARLAGLDLEVVLFVGPSAQLVRAAFLQAGGSPAVFFMCEDRQQARAQLPGVLAACAVLLVKGSRLLALEELLENDHV